MDFRTKRPSTVLLLYLIAHVVAQNPAPFIPSAEYCCHKTRNELNEMKQLDSSCRYVTWWGTFGGKCGKCPVGTCRTVKSNKWHEFTCECPDKFLTSTIFRKSCEIEWSSQWPQSAGEEASFLKSCSKKEKNTTELLERPNTLHPSAEPVPINFNARYCCHLNKIQLKNMTGVNPGCTKGSFAVSKGGKCGKCPVGMCRTKASNRTKFFCECPQWFLDSDNLHERCNIEWNKNWPDSAGTQAAFLKSCPENGSFKKPSASPTNPVQTVPSQTEPPVAKSNSTENSDGKGVGLSPEIVASIVGGIFTLVGVLITVYCMKQSKKSDSEQEEVICQYPD